MIELDSLALVVGAMVIILVLNAIWAVVCRFKDRK